MTPQSVVSILFLGLALTASASTPDCIRSLDPQRVPGISSAELKGVPRGDRRVIEELARDEFSRWFRIPTGKVLLTTSGTTYVKAADPEGQDRICLIIGMRPYILPLRATPAGDMYRTQDGEMETQPYSPAPGFWRQVRTWRPAPALVRKAKRRGALALGLSAVLALGYFAGPPAAEGISEWAEAAAAEAEAAEAARQADLERRMAEVNPEVRDVLRRAGTATSSHTRNNILSAYVNEHMSTVGIEEILLLSDGATSSHTHNDILWRYASARTGDLTAEQARILARAATSSSTRNNILYNYASNHSGSLTVDEVVGLSAEATSSHTRNSILWEYAAHRHDELSSDQLIALANAATASGTRNGILGLRPRSP